MNSYRDLSHGADAQSYTMLPLAAGGSTGMSRGFTTIYRKREGGLRFADLLDRLSAAAPDVRFRFTSPHPKDFPDELLALMKERPNICKVRSNSLRAERPVPLRLLTRLSSTRQSLPPPRTFICPRSPDQPPCCSACAADTRARPTLNWCSASANVRVRREEPV